jgi:hypothetical protein
MPADVTAPRFLFRVLPGLLGLLALAGVSAAAVKPLPAVVEFNRDIRPIMSPAPRSSRAIRKIPRSGTG